MADFFDFTQLMPPEDEEISLDLDIEDNKLVQLLVNTLDSHEAYWNKDPFNLRDTDEENVKYLIGQQIDEKRIERQGGIPYKDNRLGVAYRAVLASATDQVAMPEVQASGKEEHHVQFARDFKYAMHQHGIDNDLEIHTRMATGNLIYRKRGFLKLRFDAEAGPLGEIVVESIDPADVIISRFAGYRGNPEVIYHRQRRTTVEELIARFPNKEQEILGAMEIKQGRTSQMQKRPTWYEAWVTLFKDGQRQEAVVRFLPNDKIILEKEKNPNYIYTGDEVTDKLVNLLPLPPKPFIEFNYVNTGRSFIDETSLFDQAKPQQDLLNKRGKQLWENAERAYGKIVANSRAISQTDLDKLLAKAGPSGIAVPSEDLGRDVKEFKPAFLPDFVLQTLYDARNEIDQIMASPPIMRGQEQQNARTATENVLINNQAQYLQTDLAKAIDRAMAKYFRTLAQMMKVYYTEDHWFYMHGEHGKFDSVMLNTENIDSNVKISAAPSSTLMSDKAGLQSTMLELAKLGPDRIDNLTLFEMLELPDPEKTAQRVAKSTFDPAAYFDDIESELFDREANIDLELLKADRMPETRDEYPQGYLEHFNKFIISNRFAKLDAQVKQRIVSFLQQIVLPMALRSEKLASTQADDAQATAQTEAGVANSRAPI